MAQSTSVCAIAILGPLCLLTACSKTEEAPSRPIKVDSFYSEVVEGLPVDAIERVKAYELELAKAASKSEGATDGPTPYSSVVIKNYYRWKPGSTVTVAFLGGSPELRAQIESAANEWTAPGLANLKFSFRDAGNKFREWGPLDKSYAADIRIAFGSSGNWSHMGTASREPRVVTPDIASMNFGGYDIEFARNWHRVVLHEFGHALGFAHEQSHPAVDCGFRYDDDPGYVRTTNGATGPFIPDTENRRPGLYTWFSGPPNRWSKAKVDANLRSISKSSAYPIDDFDVLPFDVKSIMKYYFGSNYFIEGEKSICFHKDESNQLSTQDRSAVANAYGKTESLAKILETLTPVSDSKSLPADMQLRLEERLKIMRN